jgi:HPt (histidine-containing phosphotransfer) domain-containing protein
MTLDERNPTPDLTAALNQLWTRFLPETRERVAILDTAAQACAAGKITSEQREAAHAAAHKLVGALGIFGLTQGSELAREFEHTCASEESCSSEQAARLIAIAAEIRTTIDHRK